MIIKSEIDKIVSIVEDLTNTSSTNEKIEIMKKHKDNELFKRTLIYTYDKDRKYGVSEKVLNKIEESKYIGDSNKDIFEMLDILSESNINDNLRREIGLFYLNNKDNWNLYKKMILKDLRCNISLKSIDKAIPGLIFEHKVMLASKFEGSLKGRVAVTTKLDGIRCSVLLENNKVTFKTRQGKEILGLNELSKQMSEISRKGELFIDGELLALNQEGLDSDELFRKTTSIVNSKDDNKTGIKFVAFDICDLEDYKNSSNNRIYNVRRTHLENTVRGANKPLIDIVKLHTITDDVNEIHKLLDEVVKDGEEGLMLNYVDKPYDFKRSKNILKAKAFHTCDLLVVDLEEGTGKHKGRLGSVVVDYKGYKVNVGSGFMDSDREYFWNNKNAILGKIIEVGYFEESKNKNGELSLRFPTFKRLRNDKDEISYN